jgi:ABC-type transporter Mla subunit MlaD
LLLEQRQHQRAHVWKDLDDAQGLVLDLLEHAQQTAATLAAHTSTAAEDADDDANGSLVSITRRLAARTRETLAHLHAKLAPHADLVKAYQEPQRVNRMYQARIEEGLARQKKELLSRMVALEQQAKQQSSPAAAVVVVAESTEPVAVVHGESRKRKLDDEETAQSNKLAKM